MPILPVNVLVKLTGDVDDGWLDGSGSGTIVGRVTGASLELVGATGVGVDSSISVAETVGTAIPVLGVAVMEVNCVVESVDIAGADDAEAVVEAVTDGCGSLPAPE